MQEPSMRPLRYSINLTLDGCVDHTAGIPTETVHRHAAANIAWADDLLFGRVTYGMMEEAWRPVAETGIKPDWGEDWMIPFATTIHKARKHVVSNTLKQVDWNAELVRVKSSDDLVEAVQRLKQQPGKGILTGGVTLPLALAELGLIDEYDFLIHPRIAGHGPILLAGLSKPLDLKLVERRELDDGFVAVRYVPVR
jgi:dihydrofolate reductase